MKREEENIVQGKRITYMDINWIIALTIAWLTCPVNGKMTCREVQLARECEALCKRNRHGGISCELRVALLLPADPSFDIALPKVLPVLGKSFSRIIFFTHSKQQQLLIVSESLVIGSINRFGRL